MCSTFDRAMAVTLVIAFALGTVDMPAFAAPEPGKTKQAQQTVAVDLSAAKRHRRYRRGGPGNAAVLGAVGAVFGTIAAIAAADAYRDHYYGPYGYYGYGQPYGYGYGPYGPYPYAPHPYYHRPYPYWR